MPLNQYPSPPEDSDILTEGLEEIREVDQFLKEKGAAGVLVGGKACVFADGASAVEAENRKDTDVLVIGGGENLDHHTPYDLFLRDDGGTYKNRNGFALPYHLHYMGKALAPGLYLPPAEVVFLTESEMATRRAVDRVVPDIIKHKYSSVVDEFTKLKASDVVLECPGDVSWLGSVKKPFPVQTVDLEDDAGRKTLISFKWRKPNKMPATAFPDAKDIRTPELSHTSILPPVEIDNKKAYSNATTLIEAGFILQGMEYLIKRAPHMADNIRFLNTLTERHQKYPLQCADAICLWLRTAVEHSFKLLLLFTPKFNLTPIPNYSGRYSNIQEYFSTRLQAIAEELLKDYGPRYCDLADRLEYFLFDSLFPGEEIPDKYKPILKSTILNIHPSNKNLDIYFDPDSPDRKRQSRSGWLSADSVKKKFKLLVTHLDLSDTSEEEDICDLVYPFNDKWLFDEKTIMELGITDEEMTQAVCMNLNTVDIFYGGYYYLLSVKLHKNDPRTIAEVLRAGDVDLIGLFLEYAQKDVGNFSGKSVEEYEEYLNIVAQACGVKNILRLRSLLKKAGCSNYILEHVFK